MGGNTRSPLVTLRALLAPDCGPGVGLGHLERVLALADALRPEASVSVILPEGDPGLRRRVEGRGHAAVPAPGETAARVEAVAAATRFVDLVVLDGYVFDAALQRRIRERAPLTVIDDLGLAADCDLAVNPSPGGEHLRPTGATSFLGGAAYALIRSSFADARATVLRVGRSRRTVLVSTGATDIAGISGHVTAELLTRDASVEVVRVVGPDADGGAGTNQARLHLLVSPMSLADALARATLYVGAAGTTAVQAACVGIPAVINDAVANQSAQAAALAGAGCAVVADSGDLATECLRLLDDPSRCEAMAERGRALIDGRGADRVADAVRRLAQVDAA
jgi:spore coat polysaccharide biosynthesis predicted glycosyltransferase SpsG